MKPYQLVMALALAGAAGLVLFGDRTPANSIEEPLPRSARLQAAQTAQGGSTAASTAVAAVEAADTGASRRQGASGQRNNARHDVAIVRLKPRTELVGEAGDASFGAGEGVFLGQNWNPPPAAPTAAEQAAAHAPPPPPMAPPLPFRYFGKAAQDGAWEVYLARGDQTYVVRYRSVIDGAYRVERIAPPLLTLTYLPLNQVQQINIGAID